MKYIRKTIDCSFLILITSLSGGYSYLSATHWHLLPKAAMLGILSLSLIFIKYKSKTETSLKHAEYYLFAALFNSVALVFVFSTGLIEGVVRDVPSSIIFITLSIYAFMFLMLIGLYLANKSKLNMTVRGGLYSRRLEAYTSLMVFTLLGLVITNLFVKIPFEILENGLGSNIMQHNILALLLFVGYLFKLKASIRG